mmetsp:Transcript_16434/g.45847  ORF Transcript_16434/g.45847 Transcript_16434/m.45847 type:complete len:209 (-) Transcript_16434:2440-3066(-)
MVFFADMVFTTARTTRIPTVTMETKVWLKLSGRRSNPFVGDVRVKKMSGPPNARTNDWDSRPVWTEMMFWTPSTVLLYVKVINGTMGMSSMYCTKPSVFSAGFSSPLGLRVSNICRGMLVILPSAVANMILRALIPSRVAVAPSAVTAFGNVYSFESTTGFDSFVLKLEKDEACSGVENAVKLLLSIMPSCMVRTPNSVRLDFWLTNV